MSQKIGCLRWGECQAFNTSGECSVQPPAGRHRRTPYHRCMAKTTNKRASSPDMVRLARKPSGHGDSLRSYARPVRARRDSQFASFARYHVKLISSGLGVSGVLEQAMAQAFFRVRRKSGLGVIKNTRTARMARSFQGPGSHHDAFAEGVYSNKPWHP